MIRFTLFCFLALPLASMTAAASASDGQEKAAISSLSEKEIAALKSGAGMGQAKPAELNHYPGPKHVLELAEELGLTDEQAARTSELFAAVKRDSVELGEKIIAAEAKLEQAFSAGTIDKASLETMALRIGELRARLRLVHLKAHFEQAGVLSPEQIKKYDSLRGHGGKGKRHHKH